MKPNQEDPLSFKQKALLPLLGEIQVKDLFPPNLTLLVEKPELASFIQRRPPLWLRLLEPPTSYLFKSLKSKGVEYSWSKQYPHSLSLHTPLNLHEWKEHREGKMEVQDISSQGVGLTCNPGKGETWWDVCAGAGGKSLQLCDLMQGEGKVICTDLREKSLHNLRKRAKDFRRKRIKTLPWDGVTVPFAEQQFDGVLVDAPCSGSGTWRRNPALRWYYSASEISFFAQQQLQILLLASNYVRPDGVLVFSTCSLFSQEQKEVVDQFCQQNSNFGVQQEPNPLTGEEDGGFHHFSPPDPDGDFMFAVRLKRVG